jgi:hypothetical protein
VEALDVHLSSQGVGTEFLAVIRTERRKENEIMKSEEGTSQLSQEKRIRW